MYHGGPLGKYSQVVAAVLVSLIVMTKLATMVIGFLVGEFPPTPFLDNITLMALGAVLGAAASTSVNGHSIEAAHRRLDQIAAPPATHLEAHPEQQAGDNTN